MTCTTFSLFCQDKKNIEKFTYDTNAKISINKSSGVPNFIKLPTSNPMGLEGETPQQKVQSFLIKYKSLFGITDIANQVMSVSTTTDAYNLSRVAVSQLQDDVPVYDGKVYFHFNSEQKLTAINGNFVPNIKLNTNPSITKSQAENIAINEIINQG